jgi:Flp pilus assembly protein TadD
MCLKPNPAATLAALLLAAPLFAGSAVPAMAWPFGAAAKPAANAATSTAPSSAPVAPPGEKKASALERSKIEGLDPLTRVAFWTRETNLDPSDAEAGTHLAAALRASNRYEEAADAAGRVLGLNPTYAPAKLEVARANISANRGFYAIKPLQEVAAAQPRDAEPWWLLGVAYEQNEQPELARQAYEQALKLAPDSPKALTNYALFRATHGEPQAAEGLLRKAVTEPGAGAPERQNLALVLGLQGKIGEAENLIRQDLPPEIADRNLAYLRSLSGRTANAATPRSWSAVEASETVQMKAPSR